MTSDVIARAPTRIDLGGGWTDVPPFCEREGGFVCNIAITRCTTVRLTAGVAAGVGVPRSVRDASGNAHDSPMVRAALRRSGVGDVDVMLKNDFPVGAGLGGSSAASAALLGALAVWRGESWDPAEIAEAGRRIEVEDLGVAGGRQDHYAATHGGALGLTFTDKVSVRRLELSPRTRRELIARSTLIYTGESRISGDTITAVLGAYEARDPRVLGALERMRGIAMDMAKALERSDIDWVGHLLAEHWEHQRSLHPSIPTARIDEIIARARTAGALGSKAMGASGGGCVLILARADNVERVRQAVRGLGELLQFDIDDAGLVAERET
jgi:D-glycero-alpha-D-manno-heptose-7-phosphate kinase